MMMTMLDHFARQLPDIDPTETKEWIDSLDAVVSAQGAPRARYIMAKLLERLAAAPNDALAGATPYLRLFGATLGGCLLAGEALAAKADGAAEPQRYVALARFFAENISVQAPSLEKTVTESAEAITGAEAVLAG